MVWPTAKKQDHGQEQETDDGNDFNTRKYEFRLSIALDNYE